MVEKFDDLDTHMQSLTGDAKEWMEYFTTYMRNNHSDLKAEISFQMPTYKLGTGKMRNYIAFSTARNHFSMHSLDFDYITILKEKLRNPGKGKGCVNIPYRNIDERNIVIEGIKEILCRKVSTNMESDHLISVSYVAKNEAKR
jgi:uncharacterized protein YdhG (YjbR/CyaY superfamily)